MPKDRLSELRQVDKQYRIVVHLGVSVGQSQNTSTVKKAGTTPNPETTPARVSLKADFTRPHTFAKSQRPHMMTAQTARDQDF